MKALAVLAGFVAGIAARHWWETSRPIPAPWNGWPDRFDLFPQRVRR